MELIIALIVFSAVFIFVSANAEHIFLFLLGVFFLSVVFLAGLIMCPFFSLYFLGYYIGHESLEYFPVQSIRPIEDTPGITRG